jgi:all-trans-retinol 13,14-reductase
MPGTSMVEVDEVVIGAGLTGLVYAYAMARKGYRIALVERHVKPGGFATNFTRKKRFTFDCSLHKITGLGPGGNLRNSLVRLGLWEKLEFEFYGELTTVIVRGTLYALPLEYPDLKATLARAFPADTGGLERFFRDIEVHGYQNYMFARIALGEYELDPDTLAGTRRLSRMTAADYFRGLFANPDLVSLLSAIAINLGVRAEEADALYFLHFLYAFFLTGCGYVKGSSQSLSDRLASCFERAGGRLYLRQEATRAITATCCPHVVRSITPPEAFGGLFDRKLADLQFGLGAFSVYIALDRDPAECGFTHCEYIIADGFGSPDPGPEYARYRDWPLSVTNYHLLDPGNGPVIQLVVLDHKADWFALAEAQYRERKAFVQGIVLERALRHFPGLAGRIAYLEASTPRTNFSYTGSPAGSAFAYKPLPGRNVRFLQRPLPNGMKFIGTWVNGAGYETAMCLGFTNAEFQPGKGPATAVGGMEAKTETNGAALCPQPGS